MKKSISSSSSVSSSLSSSSSDNKNLIKGGIKHAVAGVKAALKGESASLEVAQDVKVNTIYRNVTRSDSVDNPNVRRVVTRVERLAPRHIHHEEFVDEQAGKIIKEYEFEEQVAVDYTAIREDVVEHIVAVPVTESDVKREKLPVRVVEVDKIVPVQRIVEVPQTEYLEQINEVPTPSGRVNKKINYVPVKKIVPQEKKVFVERPIEMVVEVPDITFIDVEEVIETVEIEEYQDVIKVKEVKVPTIVEIPKECVTERDVVTDVPVLIPVGVEAVTKVKYTVPTIVEKRAARGYPVYVPRFIEVPTNTIQMTPTQRSKSKKILQQLHELEGSHLDGGKIVSVCEIEKVGVAARDHHASIQGHINATDLKASLLDRFGVDKSVSLESVDLAKQQPVAAKVVAKEGYYGSHNVMGQWNSVNYNTMNIDYHVK